MKKKKEVFIYQRGTFITAYARNKTIRTSQAIMDYSLKKYGINKYLYSDTDSIHSLLCKEELEQFVELSDTELGKWALEGEFEKARFIRQKTYIECFKRKKRTLKSKARSLKIRKNKQKKGKYKNFKYDNFEIKITCSGMGKGCYKFVTWNNFKPRFKSTAVIYYLNM